MVMDGGAAFKILLREMMVTADKALTVNGLETEVDIFKKEIGRLTVVVEHLSKIMMDGKTDEFLSDATVFMEQISLVVIGWQWLKMAIRASEPGRFSKDFYDGKRAAARFFFQYEIPHAAACARTILEPGIFDRQFGRKLAGLNLESKDAKSRGTFAMP